MKLEDFLYSVYCMSEKPDMIEVHAEDYKIYFGSFEDNFALHIHWTELRDYRNYNVMHTYGFNNKEGKSILFIIVS